MSDHHAKKHKKQQQILKNHRHQQIVLADETLAHGRDLEKEREEKVRSHGVASSRAAAKASAGQPVWSAKMQMIRDKNTGRSTMAKERWNRFAGTENSGGRGL